MSITKFVSITKFGRTCLLFASSLTLATIGYMPTVKAQNYCSDIVASDTREAGNSATKVVDGTMYAADTLRTASVGSGDSSAFAQGSVNTPTGSTSAMNFNEKSYDFATATDKSHVEGASGVIKQQNSQYQKQSTAKAVGKDCRAAAQLEAAREANRTQLKLAEMQQRGRLVDMLMR